MKLEVEIPKEFEKDFIKDGFQDNFQRAITDITYRLKNQEIGLCGNYERETFQMFIQAFQNAKVVERDYTPKLKKQFEKIECDDYKFCQYDMDENGNETLSVDVSFPDEHLVGKELFELDIWKGQNTFCLHIEEIQHHTAYSLSVRGEDAPEEKWVKLPFMSDKNCVLTHDALRQFGNIEMSCRDYLEQFKTEGYGNPNFHYDNQNIGIQTNEEQEIDR